MADMYHNGVPLSVHRRVSDAIEADIYSVLENETLSPDEAIKQIETANHTVLGSLGVDEFSYTNFVTENGDFRTNTEEAKIIGCYDTKWRLRYLEKQYWKIDPWLTYCLSNPLPIFKSDLVTEDADNSLKDLYDEASQYGHTNGAMFPVHGVGAEVSVVSFSGLDFEMSRRDLYALQTLANTSHAIIKKVKEDERHANIYNLTSEERDILKLANNFKSSWTISTLLRENPELGMSQRTVERRLASIYHKLGAGDRTEAIVIARIRALLVQ
jgi:DNA-binding CsgD family transcriptional regulator